ncbi:phage integrase-related [Anaeramoeba flamelloides]|uniref:Phage integrase-related n=1 Tax=Anaeramoeba flamelloides TaxID=1746091 RepID=A0ABQ8YGY7_9EUKA|nr:phage integrase-related [Anaeramoeba flamelloides]
MFNGPQFYSFENQPYKNEFPNEVPMSDESLEQILKETLDEGIDVTENDQIKGEGNKVDLQNSKSELKISEEEKRVIDRSQKIHENKNSKSTRKTEKWEDFVFNSVRTYINQLFAFFSIYWLNHKLKDPPTLTNCPYSCNFFHIKLSELSEQGKTGSHRMGLTMEEEADLLESLDIESNELDLLIAAFWMIGKFTGYRGGEIFNLTKKQVQFKESKLVGTYIETYLNHRKIKTI